mmetsp:Transcript_23041/g.47788  ORF Transcript_23041/g.47788 Transcript_23041/m.47788 type:complete len:269 (-) Transcript_23041:316-1122(-)
MGARWELGRCWLQPPEGPDVLVNEIPVPVARREVTLVHEPAPEEKSFQVKRLLEVPLLHKAEAARVRLVQLAFLNSAIELFHRRFSALRIVLVAEILDAVLEVTFLHRHQFSTAALQSAQPDLPLTCWIGLAILVHEVYVRQVDRVRVVDRHLLWQCACTLNQCLCEQLRLTGRVGSGAVEDANFAVVHPNPTEPLLAKKVDPRLGDLCNRPKDAAVRELLLERRAGLTHDDLDLIDTRWIVHAIFIVKTVSRRNTTVNTRESLRGVR